MRFPLRLTMSAIVLPIMLAACSSAATPTPTERSSPSPVPTTAVVASTATLAPTATTAPTTGPTVLVNEASNLEAELDAMLQKIEAKDLLSGAVLVARDGQIVLSKGYGLADHDRKIPNTPQTRFPIGALTDQFTALAVLMLQEQGKLNVQDPICNYVAECPDTWKAITIQHLLTHSSGLPDFISSPEFHAAMDKPISRAEVIALFKDKPLDFKPGEKPYDNVAGSVLLGEIIERASGQTYPAFLQKNILDPLKMADTTFGSTGHQEALGYQTSAYAANPIDVTNLSSAAGLYSTVEDLYRWQQALDGEQLISHDSWAALLKNQVPFPEAPESGRGYGLIVGKYFERPYLGNGSTLWGFQGMFDNFPADKVTVIFLGNQENSSPGTITDLIEKKVLGVK
jgi:CubicO group peptidase (beta-lactamase class C family)